MNLKSAIGYKIKPLSQFISLLLLSFWAIMFCESAFTVDYSLFNGLVTSKQKAVETCIPILLIIVPLVYAFQKQQSLTIIDIFIFLLAAYMLFVEGIVLKSPYLTFFASSYPLILFLTVYWTLRSIRSRQILLWGIACAIMIVAVAQAFLGLMQLYSFEASHHGLFAITGSFHNPGPFSGFVVCALPIALSVSSQQLSEKEFKVLSSRFKVGEKLFSTSNLEQSPIKKFRVSRLELRHGLGLGFGYLIKVLGWLTLVLILLVLTPAQSRAAWIAGVVGCSYVLANHPKVKDFRKKLRTSFLAVRKPLRIIILSLAIASRLWAIYYEKGFC